MYIFYFKYVYHCVVHTGKILLLCNKCACIETIRYYYISDSYQKFSMIHSSTNYTMKKGYTPLLGSSSMTNLVLKLQPWRSPKQGENHMWEPCSQPKGKLRVTLILLFVAGPIGVHPPPSQHASPLPSLLPSPLLRHGPPGILWYLPSGVARYIAWLLKPLERVRWLRYSVSSYARFVYQTVGGRCTSTKQNVACKKTRYIAVNRKVTHLKINNFSVEHLKNSELKQFNEYA